MSALTAFEVQSFRNGNWKIETITDSKEIAVHQAEQVMLHPAVRKVRVVQEAFDPVSAEQKFRTVFVREKRSAKQQPAPPANGAAGAPEQKSLATAPALASRSLFAQRMTSGVGLTLTFGLIVGAGIAVILFLRHLATNI